MHEYAFRCIQLSILLEVQPVGRKFWTQMFWYCQNTDNGTSVVSYGTEKQRNLAQIRCPSQSKTYQFGIPCPVDFPKTKLYIGRYRPSDNGRLGVPFEIMRDCTFHETKSYEHSNWWVRPYRHSTRKVARIQTTKSWRTYLQNAGRGYNKTHRCWTKTPWSKKCQPSCQTCPWKLLFMKYCV